MKVTKFDKTSAKRISEELQEFLKAFGEKHGLETQYRGGTFTDAAFNLKLELKVANPEVQEGENRKRFNTFCPLYGLKPHHLGTVVQINGQDWTLVGIEPSRKKYPLRFKDRNGAVKLFTEILTDRIKASYDRQNAKVA